MSAALVAAVAVALVSIAALTWSLRSRAAAVRREARAVDEAREATEAGQEAEQAARAAESRARDAEDRAATSEQRAGDWARRAGEVEALLEEARRVEAELRSGGPAGAVTRSLWDLERVRLEREWADVVGPGVAPPRPWDGSIDAAVDTELAIIREVTGTPGELQVAGPAVLGDAGQAVLATRLSVELLRVMARAGEEMRVTVGPTYLVVEQTTESAAGAALDQLVDAAAAAGSRLTVLSDGAALRVRLDLAEG